MFKLKLINKPKMMKLKCNFTFPNIVLANLQEKNATPSKEVQEIIADVPYDGLSKVTVNAYTAITDKKIITENGTYKASDDNLDGYSEVEVTTSGVDINEYFSDTISGGSSSSPGFLKTIKKMRSPLTINGTDASYMFYNCNLEELPQIDTSNVTDMSYMFANSAATTLNLSSFNTSNVTDMSYMFYGSKATTLDLSNFDTSNVTNVYNMFASSAATTIDLSNFDISKATSTVSMFENSKVTTLDIRNFDFTNVAYYNDMFRNVSTKCLIIVKDDTAKEWITSKFTTLTNVKTVAEYEA